MANHNRTNRKREQRQQQQLERETSSVISGWQREDDRGILDVHLRRGYEPCGGGRRIIRKPIGGDHG